MSARKILACLALACCTIAVFSASLYYNRSHQLAETSTQQFIDQTSLVMGDELEVYLRDQQKASRLLAGLPQIIRQFEQPSERSSADSAYVLNHSCRALNASICYLMDNSGTVVASNASPDVPAILGNNYGFRPYFRQAVEKGSAVYLAMGVTTGRRGLYFSHQVKSATGEALGVAVIKLLPAELEKLLLSEDGIAVLIDGNGVVFAGTRQDWNLRSLWQLSGEQEQSLIRSRQFGDKTLPSLGFSQISEQQVSTADGDRYLMGSREISLLPGWRILYLKDHRLIPFSPLDDNSAAWGFGVFFLIISLAVYILYRLGSADITRRQAAELELQQSEKRLRQLIEISNEAIVIHHQGSIIDANDMAKKMFGYQLEELTDRTIWELMDPECVARSRAYYQENYELPYEVIAMHQDGSRFPVEICAKTSYVKGRELRVTCIRDITERKEQEQRVLYQAHFDALTGLPNRNLMIDRLDQAIKKAHRHNLKTVVMFVDLDDFKKINDTLGHSTGDQLLIAAGKRLQASTREGDTLARYGGDEFILILEDVDSLEDAEVVAEKMLRALSREFIIGDQSFYISGSIGIALYPEDGDDVDQLLQKADTAMYCSKDEGRNTYHFYTPKMNEHVRDRLEMEHQLRNALANNEFFLHYQPIYCTRSGRLLGAEALLRWNNDQLGFVGPDRFIPLAEQTGLIVPIGEWVLEQVCNQTRLWLNQGLEDFYVSVNISPRQFRDKQLLPFLRRTLAISQLPASALCIEITEGLLIKNDQGTAQTFAELNELGVHLSLDDFGTGYSALSYLKQFPFDTLKIDRSFVRDLVEDPSDRQLIQATVAMSEGLGLKVVAEGVEEDAQLEFLRETGCYAVQGYLLSRPLDAATFSDTIVQSVTLEQLEPDLAARARPH